MKYTFSMDGRPTSRRHHSEAEVSAIHMNNFKAEGSRGLMFIKLLCPGHNLTRESLIVLAKTFASISGVRFPRDYARRRDLVIKWFDDNFETLEPLGKLFHLEATKVHCGPSGNKPANNNGH
jgi:hypothetical protein